MSRIQPIAVFVSSILILTSSISLAQITPSNAGDPQTKTQQAIEKIESGKRLQQAATDFSQSRHKNGTGSEETLHAAQAVFDAVIAITPPRQMDLTGKPIGSESYGVTKAYEDLITQLFACGNDAQAKQLWESWQNEKHGSGWLELTRVRAIGASNNPNLKNFSFDALIRTNSKSLFGYWGKIIRLYAEGRSQVLSAPSQSVRNQRIKKYNAAGSEVAFAALSNVDIAEGESPRDSRLGPVDGKLHPIQAQYYFSLMHATPEFPKEKIQAVYNRLVKSPSVEGNPKEWAALLAGVKQSIDSSGKQPSKQENPEMPRLILVDWPAGELIN